MKLISAILLCSICLGMEAQGVVAIQQKSGIHLNISNIKKSDGLIQIGLFRSEEGYPDKPVYKYSFAKDTLKNDTIRLFIQIETPGPVSLCILDDDNRNEIMDYVWGIMPKEGFGFSNNPRISLRGAPPFSSTSFNFEGGTKKIDVRMIYMR